MPWKWCGARIANTGVRMVLATQAILKASAQILTGWTTTPIQMISVPTEYERTVTGMAEYIELTEELILSMCAGARAIANTKKYHGTIFVSGVFSENPKHIPYLQAAEILCAASDQCPADVAPVRHGRWDNIPNTYMCVAGKDGSYHGCATSCSVCHEINPNAYKTNYCPNCGAKMDGGYGNGEI